MGSGEYRRAVAKERPRPLLPRNAVSLAGSGAVLLLLTYICVAEAAENSKTKDLVESCSTYVMWVDHTGESEKHPDMMEAAECSSTIDGWITGLLNADLVYRDNKASTHFLGCGTRPDIVRTTARTLVQSVRQDPQLLSTDWQEAVRASMNARFPCR